MCASYVEETGFFTVVVRQMKQVHSRLGFVYKRRLRKENNVQNIVCHNTMQPNHAGRISGTSLSMEQPHFVQDPVSLTVAQKLPNRPNHTRQRSALTIASSQSQHFDRTDAQSQIAERSADVPPESKTRRANITSNTWTSSSGDVVSDQDEVDDRSSYVQEYNRLAKKVCPLGWLKNVHSLIVG